MVKINDYVKIEGQGIGKVERLYPKSEYNETGSIVINIAGVNYYRDIDENNNINDYLNDCTIATEKEYMQYLKAAIKQLTEQSKSKRKQAAEYNKSTNGEAVSRKGKVSVQDGNIMGFTENALSSQHRSMLTDAKKAKELKDKLKNELQLLKAKTA
jgi:hypothetical protein